jgi:hypothetical protein
VLFEVHPSRMEMFWNKGEKQRKNCSSALVSVQAFNLYFSLGFKLISNRLSADCLFGVKALHMMEIQLFCAWFLFPNSSCLHLFFFFLYIYIYYAENEGICIFSLPKLCSLSSTRRIITCGRWIHGTWNHHLCHPWCNARYTNLIMWY